jgi:3'-phosphoadenosine 5'-phosphosulfate sulfotransferase (PAPS reductase)/FAD synthetase
MSEYTNEELQNMYNDLRSVVTRQENIINRLREVIELYIKDETRVQSRLQQFFEMLDTVEESDSGREFHPVNVSCCRAMMIEPLNEVLTELKNYAYDERHPGAVRTIAQHRKTWIDGKEHS